MSDRAGPTRDDIEAARRRIAERVRRTPVLDVEPGVLGVDAPLTLKLELLQVTGSFKPRGAFNRMLTADVGPAGVVAASGGNFGLAVGHAARELGYRATIFVPATSPAGKLDKVRATGADVRVIEGTTTTRRPPRARAWTTPAACGCIPTTSPRSSRAGHDRRRAHRAGARRRHGAGGGRRRRPHRRHRVVVRGRSDVP